MHVTVSPTRETNDNYHKMTKIRIWGEMCLIKLIMSQSFIYFLCFNYYYFDLRYDPVYARQK